MDLLISRRLLQGSDNNGDPSFPYRTSNSGACTWHTKSAVAKTKRVRNGQSRRTHCKSTFFKINWQRLCLYPCRERSNLGASKVRKTLDKGKDPETR